MLFGSFTKTMKRYVKDDIRFLKQRLFEDAMQFVYKKKHDSNDLEALICIKDKSSMRKLEEAPSLYKNKIEVVHHSFDVKEDMTAYYKERDDCLKILRESFCDVITNKEGVIDYTAFYLDFIFSEDSQRLHVHLILYEQTKENLLDETIQALERMRKEDSSVIGRYLSNQSFLFYDFEHK